MDNLEWSLLEGRDRIDAAQTDPTIDVIRDTISGRFLATLGSPAAVAILKPLNDCDELEYKSLVAAVQATLLEFVQNNGTGAAALAVGSALLGAYVRENFTGPSVLTHVIKQEVEAWGPQRKAKEELAKKNQGAAAVSSADAKASGSDTEEKEEEHKRDVRILRKMPVGVLDVAFVDKLQRLAVRELPQNGEDVSDRAVCGFLLLLARVLLVECVDTLAAHTQSADWWAARCTTVHQAVLDDNASDLQKLAQRHFSAVLQSVGLEDCQQAVSSSASAAAAAVDDDKTSVVEPKVTDEDKDEAKQASPLSIPPDWTSSRRALAARAYTEAAYSAMLYWRYKEAKRFIDAAAQLSGVRSELTGALGRRTRWQKSAKSQLIVAAGSADDIVAECESADEYQRAQACLLTDVEVNSDVLLNHIKLEKECDVVNTPLAPIDQLVLFARMINVRYVNPASHVLTKSEMIAYVNRLLMRPPSTCPASWAVHYATLFERSFLQLQDRHMFERCINQLETLFNELEVLQPALSAPVPLSFPSYMAHAVEEKAKEAGIATPDSDSTSSSAPSSAAPTSAQLPRLDIAAVTALRMRDFYSLRLPPTWELKRTLAQVYTNMGMHNSALAIYEQTNDWEGRVRSLQRVGRNTEAEALVRMQLDTLDKQPVEQTGSLMLRPKLYCLLGKITRDMDHYRTAWEVSNQRYARAQAVLGKYMLDNKKYKECIQHLDLALAINAANKISWFALGVACMEEKEWEKAANAFVRHTALDPEYGEAWNNLAVAHLRRENYVGAFGALEVCTKLKRDSWRVWDNFLSCAMHLGKHSAAMSAVKRVAELHKDHAKRIDPQIFRLLTKVAIKDFGSRPEHSPTKSFLISKWRTTLLELSRTLSHPVVWASLVAISNAVGDTSKAIEYGQKQNRLLEKGNWEQGIDEATAVLGATGQLVEAYLQDGSAASLSSARMLTQRLAARAQKSSNAQVSGDVAEQLTALAERVQSASNNAATSAGADSSSSGLSDYLSMWK